MATWPTAFGNNGRNSSVNEAATLGRLLWTYVAGDGEGLQGGEYGLVAGTSHLWLETVRQEIGFVSSRFLYCLDLAGNLISKTQLTSADVWNEGNGRGLSLDSSDNCYVTITSAALNENAIQKYLPDGTLAWTFTKNSDVPGNPPHYSCPAIDGSDRIWIGRRDTITGTAWVTCLDTSGSIVSEFNTGLHDTNSSLPLTLDTSGVYLVGRPGTGVYKTIYKYDFIGTLLWSLDVTTIPVAGMTSLLGPVSVQGNLLVAYGFGSDATLIGVDATTGADIWYYQPALLEGNSSPCITIGSDGNVYVGNDNDVTLLALDGTNGSVLWSVVLDPGSGNASVMMASYGSDGVRWGYFASVNGDGSPRDSSLYDSGTGALIQTTSFPQGTYQPVLSDGRVYLVQAGNPFSQAFSQPNNPAVIYAYSTPCFAIATITVESPSGVVDIIGGTAPGVNLNVEIALSGPDVSGHCVSYIRARVAGEPSGTLYASGAYGAPSTFTVDGDTISPGNVLILELPCADLAGLAAGRAAQFMVEYVGGFCVADLVLIACEWIYDTSP